MIKQYKYYPGIIVIVSLLLFSCSSANKKHHGEWESIKIENSSSLFKKTLPSSLKGEVLLTLEGNGSFSWVNKIEKTDLSGDYSTSSDTLFFNIKGERDALAVKFKVQNSHLTIITDDGFIFTFTKKDQK